MKRSHPHLPNNLIAATILLLALILVGGGVLNWQKARMESEHLSQFKSNHQEPLAPTNAIKAEILRRQENISIYKHRPRPFEVPRSDKSHVVFRIPTEERVVFITIDDGVTKDHPASEFMRARKLPITAFLTISDIDDNFAYFSILQKDGTDIENHTVSHTAMPKLPFDKQRDEICQASDILHQRYGKRPSLFRPPYGEYNDDTLKAAATCGIKAVVLWSAVMQGRTMHYQKEPQLKPGDIILLHYKPELKQDIEAVLKAAREQGFKIGRLEDWIK